MALRGWKPHGYFNPLPEGGAWSNLWVWSFPPPPTSLVFLKISKYPEKVGMSTVGSGALQHHGITSNGRASMHASQWRIIWGKQEAGLIYYPITDYWTGLCGWKPAPLLQCALPPQGLFNHCKLPEAAPSACSLGIAFRPLQQGWQPSSRAI